MPLGNRGQFVTEPQLTLCLPNQSVNKLQFLSKCGILHCINKYELNVSSSPGSHFPQGRLSGSSGFFPLSPFPCRDHLLGSGGCHSSNQYPELAGWAAKGSKRVGQFLTSSLISSFTFQIECLPACFAEVNPVCLKLVQT